MKIDVFKKIKNNKYKVILDTEEEIVLYDDVIVKFNLLSNKNLDDNKLKEITRYNCRMDAYYLSIQTLNKKMRTRKELFDILKKKEIDDSVINEVLDKLEEEKYLNNNRYINAYINDQINLGNIGPNKIRKNLVDLGLNLEEINVYLDAIDLDVWKNKIYKYINKKMKSTNNLSANKLKQKLAIDLVNKGYQKELVMDILNEFEFVTDKELLLKEYNKIKKKLEIKYNDRELSYHIKYKLLSKGFTTSEIEEVLKGE